MHGGVGYSGASETHHRRNIRAGRRGSRAVLNYLLQGAQERGRWRREDRQKFEPERPALYRDFLNELERTRYLERFDQEKLGRFLTEMGLLGSRADRVRQNRRPSPRPAPGGRLALCTPAGC